MRALTLDDFKVGPRGQVFLKSYDREQLQCPLCASYDAVLCPHSEREMQEALEQSAPARPAAPHPSPSADWFVRYLQNDREARKQAPVARGLHGYFPNACVQVSHVSFVANKQHNPGLPMQWAFNKSSDEADCQIRHGLDASAQGGSPLDDDGLLHLAKKAWRAMAELERYCLEHYPDAKPGASVTGFTRVSPARVGGQ